MHHDVVRVKALVDYELELTFDDGKSGILDCKPLIAKGGVFATLREPEVFRRAAVNAELGVVSWDGVADIAPETAYSLATGASLPDWMESGEPPDAHCRDAGTQT